MLWLFGIVYFCLFLSVYIKSYVKNITLVKCRFIKQIVNRFNKPDKFHYYPSLMLSKGSLSSCISSKHLSFKPET